VLIRDAGVDGIVGTEKWIGSQRHPRPGDRFSAPGHADHGGDEVRHPAIGLQPCGEFVRRDLSVLVGVEPDAGGEQRRRGPQFAFVQRRVAVGVVGGQGLGCGSGRGWACRRSGELRAAAWNPRAADEEEADLPSQAAGGCPRPSHRPRAAADAAAHGVARGMRSAMESQRLARPFACPDIPRQTDRFRTRPIWSPRRRTRH